MPDEVDLRTLAKILRTRRWYIVFGTVIAVSVTWLFLFLSPNYRAEGFFQLSGSAAKSLAAKQGDVDLLVLRSVDYRKYSSLLFDRGRFRAFVSRNQSFDVDVLERLAKSARPLEEVIEPRFAISSPDLKALPEAGRLVNDIWLGVRISVDERSSQRAEQAIKALGSYVRDSVMLGFLRDFVEDRYGAVETAKRSLELQSIDTKFELERAEKKRDEVKQINARYPQLAKTDSRQVVSVGEGGSHYLTPIFQLVGLESQIADLHDRLAWLSRETEKTLIRADYFARVRQETAKAQSADAFLLAMIHSRDQVFKERNSKDEAVHAELTSSAYDLATFQLLFGDTMRLMAGPYLTREGMGGRALLIIVLVGAAAFFFLILAALFAELWSPSQESASSQGPGRAP